MVGAANQALGDEAPSSFQLRLQRHQQQQQQHQPQQHMDGGDRSSYGTGAGAGGKARSSAAPNRRKTPYDRPSQGRHASASPHAASRINGAAPGLPSSSSWLGAGLVGTASKFLTSSASYLFSSVFGRRENSGTPLALPQGGDTTPVEREDNGEHVVQVSQSKSMEIGDGQGRPSHQPHIAETSRTPESLWRKPTLTSEEYLHLSRLLQSRIVDNGAGEDHVSDGHEMKGTADGSENLLEYGTPVGTMRWRDEPLNHVNDSRQNGSPRNGAVQPFLTTPGVRELNNGSDSPVDIARAFMGDRAARAPGSLSPAQAPQLAVANSSDPGPSPLPVSTSVVVKKSATNEFSRNIFQTPATWSSRPVAGLYGTPYSRPNHLTAARELPTRPSPDGSAPSRWTPIRAPLTSGSQSLKRRSNALDDGWASVGPIRRTRRKWTVAPSATGSGLLRSFGDPSDGDEGEARPLKLDSDDRSSLFGESSGSRGKTIAGSSGLKKIDDRKGVSSAVVPAQSTETARKILETLDRMVPSPEQKKLDEELACVRRKPPGRLTDDMLNDRARRSMQDPGDLDLGDPELQKAGGYFSGQAARKSTLSAANGKGKGKAILPSGPPSMPDEGAARVVSFTSGPHAASDSPEGSSRNFRSSVLIDPSTPTEQGGFRMSIDSDLQGSDSDREGARNVQKAAGGGTVPSGSVSGLGRRFGETTSFALDGLKSSSPSQIPTSSGMSGAPGSSLVRVAAPFPSGAADFQNPQSPDSSKGKSSGSFSFQTTPILNSNPYEPPPTPKPIPSPAMNGGAAASTISELPLFQFGTATAEKPRVVFSAIPGPLGQPGAVGDNNKLSQTLFSTATSSAFPSLGQGPFESVTQSAGSVDTSVRAIEVSNSAAVSAPTLQQGSAPVSDQNATSVPESSLATGVFGASSVSTGSFWLGTASFGGASSSGLGLGTSTSTMFQGFGKDVTCSSAATVSAFGSASGVATTPIVQSSGSGLSLLKPPMAYAAGSSGSGMLGSSFPFTASSTTTSASTPLFGDAVQPITAEKLADVKDSQPVVSGVGSTALTFSVSAVSKTDAGEAKASMPPLSMSAGASSSAVLPLSSTMSSFPVAASASPLFGGAPSAGGFGALNATSGSFGQGSSGFDSSTSVFGSGGTYTPSSQAVKKDMATAAPSTASVFPPAAPSMTSALAPAAPSTASAFAPAAPSTASPAPNSLFSESEPKTQAPFSFGSSGAGSSASAYTFTGKATAANTGFPSTVKSPEATGTSSQPAFGMVNTSPALVASSVHGVLSADTGGEHTSMEEMAEEPSVPVSGPVSIFQQSSMPSSGFMFGQQGTPSAQPPLFGQPPAPTGQAPQFGSSASSGQGALFRSSSASAGQTPVFGQVAGSTGQGPVFGQASASAGQPPVFGQPPASTGQAPVFGQPSASSGQTTVFGQTSAAPGQTPFGQPTTLTGQTPFGQTTAPTGQSLFGQANAPTGQLLFGQAPAPIGQTPFGSAPPVQPSVFGLPNSSGQPSVFGQPSTSVFSQPSALSGQSEVFSFSAQSSSFEAGAQNPFSAGFSMGAGGPEQRQGRKFVKASKRIGGQRRGR